MSQENRNEIWIDETLGMLNKFLSVKDKNESKDERVLREIRTREATRALLSFGVSCIENGQEIPQKLSEFLVLCISNSKNNEHLYAPLLSIMTSNPNPHDNFFKEEFELRMLMLEMVRGYNHMQAFKKKHNESVYLKIGEAGQVVVEVDGSKPIKINTCQLIARINELIEEVDGNDDTFWSGNELTITEIMLGAYSAGAIGSWENKKMTYDSVRDFYRKTHDGDLHTTKEKRMGLRGQFKDMRRLPLDSEGRFTVDDKGKLVSKVIASKSNNQ